MGKLLRLYRKLTRSRALKWIYPDVPTAKLRRRFANRVRVDDPEVAMEILAEAQELFRVPFDRADAAERRATTLQGQSRSPRRSRWRRALSSPEPTRSNLTHGEIAFAVAIAVVVSAFVVAGAVALQATSRINRWRYPANLEQFVELRGLSVADARTARAAALVRAHRKNVELARWKIKRTTLAARWFRGALILLLGLAILFAVYVAGAG